MKTFIILFTFMFFSVPAFAADVQMKWDAVSGATGYKIYMSTDMGDTWDNGVDVGMAQQNPTVPSERIYTYQNVPEDRMVLFKGSAYNANAETIRDWSGAWYDHRKKPLETPGLGIR